ncbi:hypothetical protein ACERII_21140, partial [Evansella sp. AB-rgal1]|uniref:hypothetical protein n=1 Tax=Evansella sp. AB-rgal1 TaxID=3242696 RepID=UPI00359E68DD
VSMSFFSDFNNITSSLIGVNNIFKIVHRSVLATRNNIPRHENLINLFGKVFFKDFILPL